MYYKNLYYFIVTILFVLLHSCNDKKEKTAFQVEKNAPKENSYSRQVLLHNNYEEKGIGLITNGHKNEYWKFYYKNGKIKNQGRFFNDLKYGWWQYFDSTGVLLKEGQYTNDKMNGYWKFYKNAIIEKEGKYENDLRWGSWKFYNTHGKLVEIHNYK